MNSAARMLMGLMLATPAWAAAPQPDDFSSGISLTPMSSRPMVQVAIPDDVYAGITRSDLGDLRVFNADGVVVPHALCSGPMLQAAQSSLVELPVFELQRGVPAREGRQIEVETEAGTQLRIDEGGAADAATSQPGGHVINATSITESLRRLQFDWSSPDGASEAQVRVESSDDLNRWEVVVASSSLLKVVSGPNELARPSIELPVRRYRYLRVERIDGGPALRVEGVIAERVGGAQAIDPVWFAADALPAKAAVPGERASLDFDARRLAPVTEARWQWPSDNASLQVELQSRANEQGAWVTRWRGETYSIVTDGNRRNSAPAGFESTTDRWWRVQLVSSGAQFTVVPRLELGYRPALLRFLAQGAGPFTLAFGSRRAEIAPRLPCEALLADVPAADLPALIDEPVITSVHALGGTRALEPLPKPTPTRRIVLWGVLIVGVAMLAAMALTLFRRLQSSGGGSPEA